MQKEFNEWCQDCHDNAPAPVGHKDHELSIVQPPKRVTNFYQCAHESTEQSTDESKSPALSWSSLALKSRLVYDIYPKVAVFITSWSACPMCKTVCKIRFLLVGV